MNTPITTPRRGFLTLIAGAAPMAALATAGVAEAASAGDINRDSQRALHKLYALHPFARRVAHDARAVLVFPKIIKAGLVFGGSFGEGELMVGGRPESYFNSIGGSWGFQAGAQAYSYVVFLMSDKALRYIHESHGWEIGVGPTVVVVDEGKAKNLSTTTLKDDAYAFIYGQKGLMAGISLEGNKISHIRK
jgi:lipid-binding SYLF domain-containing protein